MPRPRTSWTGRLDEPPGTDPHPHHRPTPGSRARRVTSDSPTSSRLLAGDMTTEDEPAHGLHKFDLGTVPASVTPPRSSHHAAWFAVVSSCAALSGLALATFTLVQQPTPPGHNNVDLHGMPRARSYPSIPASDQYFLSGDPTRPEASHRAGLVQYLTRQSATSTSGKQTGLPGQPVGPPGSGSQAVPGSRTDSSTTNHVPSSPSTRPPTDEAPHLIAFSDIEAIKQRSDQYFEAIRAKDPRQAWGLTTGELREAGYEAFARPYAGTTSIEVIDVYATPTSTVTTLRMARENGLVETRERKLRFTSDADPLIKSDEPA